MAKETSNGSGFKNPFRFNEQVNVMQSFVSMNDTDKKLLKDNLSYAKDNYKGFEDEIDKCINHIDLL